MAATKKSEEMRAVVMGIDVRLDPKTFDNLELLDALDEVNEGNALKIPKVMKMIFGDDWNDVKNKLRNEKGVVTTTKASEFLVELMEAFGELKN